MPLVVNEVSKDERNSGGEGISSVEHLSGRAGMKNMRQFVIENISCYERREHMADNGDHAQYSEGLIQLIYGWSVSVAFPAAPL